MSPELFVGIIGASATLFAAYVSYLTLRVARKHTQADVGPNRAASHASRIRAFITAVIAKRPAVVTTTVVVLIAAITLVVAQLVGKTHDAQRRATARWTSLIRKAQHDNRDFILPSVTVLADVRRAPSQRSQYIVQIRSIYAVQPLRHIGPAETAFVERYGFASAQSQRRWYGANPEAAVDQSGYQVQFQASESHPATLVTGVNVTLRAGELPAGLALPFDIPPDARIIWYPNSDDYIGQVLFVVQSPEFLLEPIPRGALRMAANGRIIARSDAFLGSGPARVAGERSVSARWDDITPGETVALAVRAREASQ